MRLSTVIIIWGLVLYSCTNDKPRWTYEDPNNYKPDKIQLESWTLDGLKLKTTKDDLINKFGQPIRQVDSAGMFYEKESRHSHKFDSTIWTNAYYYGNNGKIRFSVWENNATIKTIDFRESNTELETPDIALSSKTEIKEIKAKFPTSYDWRNAGLNKARDTFFHFNDNEVKDRKFDWIHLENESGQYVELTFIDGKLAFLYNDVTD